MRPPQGPISTSGSSRAFTSASREKSAWSPICSFTGVLADAANAGSAVVIISSAIMAEKRRSLQGYIAAVPNFI
ncbi:hypothetical protein DEW08_19330 [Azospirillum thermophilum]|uniref:Uncharacterized protein n=1 Tax=Azospirillum thermophilum TaxID=2202148 RepID=A0A2S2CUR6_9PROT|nr:hypothetical protein DEW08_19330 [Azospirillum thermophilum]